MVGSAGQVGDGASSGCFLIKRSLDEGDEKGLKLAIALAKAGEASGIEYLYNRYADNVFSYVQAILRDSYDAEDVTQQVFAKMLTAIVRYEPRAVPFSAWILRVARNAAIDHLRKDREVLSDE